MFPHRRLESPYPCSSHCSQLVDPLELSLGDLQYHDHVKWDGSLHHCHQKFTAAKDTLNSHKSIVLSCASDQLWIVTAVSVSELGRGATLYDNCLDRLLPPGFYSFASIRSHGYRVRSKPCLSHTVKPFSPFIIQSKHRACVLTDSQPCVQALQNSKLCRREISPSPRVTSFLTTVSRYKVSLQHLAGIAKLHSDFASRNAQNCTEPNWQICFFVHVSVFSCTWCLISTSPWQHQAPTLHQQPCVVQCSKRVTWSTARVCSFWNLAFQETEQHRPLSTTTLPPYWVDSHTLFRTWRLLTDIHIKPDHPSKHQLQTVIQRHFFALDMSVSDSCHICYLFVMLYSLLASLIMQKAVDWSPRRREEKK